MWAIKGQARYLAYISVENEAYNQQPCAIKPHNLVNLAVRKCECNKFFDKFYEISAQKCLICI